MLTHAFAVGKDNAISMIHKSASKKEQNKKEICIMFSNLPTAHYVAFTFHCFTWCFYNSACTYPQTKNDFFPGSVYITCFHAKRNVCIVWQRA